MINTRFTADFPGAINLEFEVMGLKKSRTEAKLFLKKLILIHSIVTEPKEDPQGE